MHMGKSAPGITTISAVVPDEYMAVVDARANALSLSRSRFAAMVFERWIREGAPPVSEPDRHMAPQVMAALEAQKKAAVETQETRLGKTLPMPKEKIEIQKRLARERLLTRQDLKPATREEIMVQSREARKFQAAQRKYTAKLLKAPDTSLPKLP